MQFEEINIVNVDFSIDKKKILKNINIKIKKNEKIAVIGSSGSGKTQLLHMISLFSKPDKGIISFNEKNFWRINSPLIKQIRKNRIGADYDQFCQMGLNNYGGESWKQYSEKISQLFYELNEIFDAKNEIFIPTICLIINRNSR